MAKNCCILECVSKATLKTTFNITLSRPRNEVKREFPLTPNSNFLQTKYKP